MGEQPLVERLPANPLVNLNDNRLMISFEVS